MRQKSKKNRIPIMAFLLILISLGSFFLVSLVLGEQRESYLQMYEIQQKQLNEVAANQLALTIKQGDSIASGMEQIGYMVAAGKHRWIFLYEEGHMIYAQQETLLADERVSRFRLPDLMRILEKQGRVGTVSEFIVKGKTYSLGIETDFNGVLEQENSLQIEAYLFLIVGGLFSGLFVSVLFFIGVIRRRDQSIRRLNETLIERNLRIEQMVEVQMNIESDLVTNQLQQNASMANRSGIERMYRFKLYLNASHAISINGVRGERHPHTWEIAAHIIQQNGAFVEFAKIEEELEKIIEPYQDSFLNEKAPFTQLNPTLENICQYFKVEILRLSIEKGWLLDKIEMSETPTRSYVIDLKEESMNR